MDKPTIFKTTIRYATAISQSWEKKTSIGQFRSLKHYKYITKSQRWRSCIVYKKRNWLKFQNMYLPNGDEGNFESLIVVKLGNEKNHYWYHLLFT